MSDLDYCKKSNDFKIILTHWLEQLRPLTRRINVELLVFEHAGEALVHFVATVGELVELFGVDLDLLLQRGSFRLFPYLRVNLLLLVSFQCERVQFGLNKLTE